MAATGRLPAYNMITESGHTGSGRLLQEGHHGMQRTSRMRRYPVRLPSSSQYVCGMVVHVVSATEFLRHNAKQSIPFRVGKLFLGYEREPAIRTPAPLGAPHGRPHVTIATIDAKSAFSRWRHVFILIYNAGGALLRNHRSRDLAVVQTNANSLFPGGRTKSDRLVQ